MTRFPEFIVKHRKKVIAVVLAAAAISILLYTQVGINYDVVDYLPEDSPSTGAITLLNDEYPGGVPNARVMVSGVSIPEALALKDVFLSVDGVNEVQWLDDAVSLETPVEYLDPDIVDDYYRDGTALFTLTLDDAKATAAVHEIRDLAGDDAKMSGMKVSEAFATDTIEGDLVKVLAVAVPLVLLILVLTTSSWIEPLLFVFTIGVAVIINMGTNIVFGQISFVTQGIAALLQLAIAIDYAIFLLHRYGEHIREGMEEKQAMVLAMKRAATSIIASGITAAIGFVSLMVMRFGVGPDIGWVMVKGILISVICVFTLLPALTICCSKLVKKTSHRSFIPDLHKPVKKLKKFCIPALIIMLIVIVPCVIAVENNHYVYFEVLDGPDTRVGQDTQAIKDTFGDFSSLVLMVPNGDFASERELLSCIEDIPIVSGVVSYSKTVGTEIPQEYPDPETLSKLVSDDYTRYVITVNTTIESDEAFAAVETLRSLGEQYYPGKWALAGEIANAYDLRDCVKKDDIWVNLVGIGGIFLVLMLIFRSLITPAVLVFVIESSIWINCSIPYFMGDSLFYFARMIIFALQLAATVDYGILLVDRYFAFRKTLPKREAMRETMCAASVSIITSAAILLVSGFSLAFLSSNVLLSAVGILIARGALLSVIAVLFVLPALLLLFDKAIQKLTIGAKFVKDDAGKPAVTG